MGTMTTRVRQPSAATRPWPGPERRDHRITADAGLTPLAARVRGEYMEMPGLRLTVRQAARLFSLSLDVARLVLDELQYASVLTSDSDDAYSLRR